MDGLVQRIGRGRIVERMAQHQRHREQHRVRIGNTFAGDVRRRAVDRFVHAEAILAQRGGRQQSHRSAQHRRLVGKDVAEQVFRQQHVERTRARQQVHRGRVHQHVLEPYIGKFLAYHPRYHFPPQARGVQHIGLVDMGNVPLALPGELAGLARNPLDFSAGIAAQVLGLVRIAAALAEIDAAGEFTHHQQVHPGKLLRLDRRKPVQSRVRHHRPQVAEQPELRAQP